MQSQGERFIQDCDRQMDHYASRGVISHFARRQNRGGSHPRVTYQFKWHLGHNFELVADSKAGRLTFPCLLPGVDRKDVLDADLREFVKSLTGPGVAKHKRLAENPANVRLTNRQGSMALSIAAENDDTRALVERTFNLGHQVFALFLRNGGYDEYLVEVFDIDLDSYR